MIYIKNIFYFLFLFLPLSLITGPAVPDLTITFGVIFGLFWILYKEKNYSLIKNKFFQISIFFWLILILISFFAVFKDKSFQDSIIFLRYLLIPICCYYLFFSEYKKLKNLFFVIFILIIFVSVDTIYQFFNYSSQNGFGSDLIGFKSDWYGRLTGPFGDELIPGAYISKFGLVGFVYLLLNKKFNTKIIIQSIYLAMILIVCFASGERMAFASYSLGLIVLLIFLKQHRLAILFSIIIGITSIYMIYKFHPFYNDFKILESTQYHQGLKIEKTFKCESEQNKTCKKVINIQPSFVEILKNFSSSAYGEIYLLSLEMFKDNPVTGIGISNFKKLCEQDNEYKNMMVNYDCASHPHNTYIQWMTEGGLLTLIFFMIYLTILCNLIIKNEGENQFKIISLVLLLILFWPIMSTGSLIKNWYGITVFFIIGISMCLSKLKIND